MAWLTSVCPMITTDSRLACKFLVNHVIQRRGLFCLHGSEPAYWSLLSWHILSVPEKSWAVPLNFEITVEYGLTDIAGGRGKYFGWLVLYRLKVSRHTCWIIARFITHTFEPIKFSFTRIFYAIKNVYFERKLQNYKKWRFFYFYFLSWTIVNIIIRFLCIWCIIKHC